MKALALTALALSVAALWFTAPTQEDIDHCTATTNYTAERCLMEMTR